MGLGQLCTLKGSIGCFVGVEAAVESFDARSKEL